MLGRYTSSHQYLTSLVSSHILRKCLVIFNIYSKTYNICMGHRSLLHVPVLISMRQDQLTHYDVSFFSLQTAVLGTFYITAMGYALHTYGIQMNNINNFHLTFSNGGLSSYRLLFTGSFLACLFWVSTVHSLSSPTLYIHVCFAHRQWCRQCGHGMPPDSKLRKNWQKINR